MSCDFTPAEFRETPVCYSSSLNSRCCPVLQCISESLKPALQRPGKSAILYSNNNCIAGTGSGQLRACEVRFLYLSAANIVIIVLIITSTRAGAQWKLARNL